MKKHKLVKKMMRKYRKSKRKPKSVVGIVLAILAAAAIGLFMARGNNDDDELEF